LYYDKGLDVLQASAASQETPGDNAGLSLAEAIKVGEVKAVAEDPPAGLFAHTGKVLIEHDGEERRVDEDEIQGHIGHGDEVLDPTGRSGAEGGRR
jgi:hypothetical protein